MCSARDDGGMTTSLGPGWRVGHWSDPAARTGCTVIVPPRGNVASCDIRGSSPSSRELALLHPDRRLTEVHAVLLTGGSAFGLAAAQGVAEWLEERGAGYATSAGPVPIVPAAVVFDLTEGRPDIRPGPSEGRAACDAATETDVATGLVGAGTGATVGKWAGGDLAAPGGLGMASATGAGGSVSALAVVNSVGDVVDDDGSVIAGSRHPTNTAFGATAPRPREAGAGDAGTWPGTSDALAEDGPTSTVLALVAVHAPLDKRDARWLAARGADGITLSVRPAHTRYDGDVVFAVCSSHGRAAGASLDVLGRLATEAVASAVRNAVRRDPPS